MAVNKDPELEIKQLKEIQETLLMKLSNCQSVKEGEIGMNQALKAEIEKLKIYVKVLSDLNDKYVEEIAKAKADLHFFIERK
jgi:molybdenum cofactor biosynthesis enzyme MoaA|tara:strand:+ start:1027 stop:1272 length:246 start_codon:yes stop_codon:yes gene_type:complete